MIWEEGADMPNAVNVVPIIDTSNSMTTNGYVAITVRAASAFVSYARPGDGLGVVNYDVGGNVTFGFATVDQNLTQPAAAAAAIAGLRFTGGWTAIGSGLQTGEGMLNSQATPKALVLLSDGYNNSGPDPLTVLPVGYPVYSCAMGPNADITLMQQIASRTSGLYYNAPYPSTMMFIFNQIRGIPASVQTVANRLDSIPVQGYQMIPATISGSNSGSQFGVVWDNNNLSYTSGSNPTASQISITLVDPSGGINPIAPVRVGAGYVVFDIPNPVVGTWYVQVISGSNTVAVLVTSGAFEFPTNQQSAAALELSVPAVLKAGQPLNLTAKITEDGQTVAGVKMDAEVLRPLVSVSSALNLYRDQWKDITLTDQDDLTGTPPDIAKLAKLRRQLLPTHDLLAHRTHPVALKETSGSHTASLTDTLQAGSYTIRVVARGISPKTKTALQRTELATVCVQD
jgi:von Willebrand factor type A domain